MLIGNRTECEWDTICASKAEHWSFVNRVMTTAVSNCRSITIFTSKFHLTPIPNIHDHLSINLLKGGPLTSPDPSPMTRMFKWLLWKVSQEFMNRTRYFLTTSLFAESSNCRRIQMNGTYRLKPWHGANAQTTFRPDKVLARLSIAISSSPFVIIPQVDSRWIIFALWTIEISEKHCEDVQSSTQNAILDVRGCKKVGTNPGRSFTSDDYRANGFRNVFRHPSHERNVSSMSQLCKEFGLWSFAPKFSRFATLLKKIRQSYTVPLFKATRIRSLGERMAGSERIGWEAIENGILWSSVEDIMLLSHTQLLIDYTLSKKVELRRSGPITPFLKDTDQH
jgi:hypothetical protein